jgi:hypothetical protein
LYRAYEAPPTLGKESREFFLPRKDVRNGEIVFTESAPHPFLGQKVARIFDGPENLSEGT